MVDEAKRYEQYAEVVAKAFSALRADFPGLSFDNRLMIITPDESFRSSLEPHLQRTLQALGGGGGGGGGGGSIKLVSAQEACATFPVQASNTHFLRCCTKGCRSAVVPHPAESMCSGRTCATHCHIGANT